MLIRDAFPFTKGFGLTIGSDLSILFVNHKRYSSLGVIKSGLKADVIHGTFVAHNASNSTTQLGFAGTFGFINATNSHISRGRFLLSLLYILPCVPISEFFAHLIRAVRQGVTAIQAGRGTASRSLGGRCSSWCPFIRPAPLSRICSRLGALGCPS